MFGVFLPAINIIIIVYYKNPNLAETVIFTYFNYIYIFHKMRLNKLNVKWLIQWRVFLSHWINGNKLHNFVGLNDINADLHISIVFIELLNIELMAST